MEKNEQLLSAIFNVGRLIKEKTQLSNRLAGFTQTEIETLQFLQGKKNTTMTAIADYLHIKPPSVTPIIDSLVEKKDLKRFFNSKDRRMVYIELTSKGRKSLQKKYKNMHKTVGQIFGKLNNKDKKALISIFEKIHAENK